MTRTRALIGALATGSLALGLAGTASAQNNIAVVGTTSELDVACLGLLLVVGNPECSFDALQIAPPFVGVNISGPIGAASTYQVGQSPWDRNGGPGDIGGVIGDPAGDPKYSAPLVNSTLTIDDKGTPCDADDTLAATIAYGAATRNFSGGPGTQGEETWGDGDLSFTLAETVVDFATPNGGGGCDYAIGDAGAPVLLMSSGGAQYGDDVLINSPPGAGEDLWLPNDGTDYQGNTPTLSTMETTPNAGEPLTVANGPTYVCDFFGGAGGCEADGADHDVATGGSRATIENSIWVVSTDAAGNVTNGNAYPISETLTGGFNQPAWDGPIWIFTGTCTNCAAGPTANPDSSSTLEGVAVIIDILANDSNLSDPTTVSLPGGGATAQGGTVAINGTNPGDPAQIDVTYTPPGVAAPFQDTFDYMVDVGGQMSTATVTVDVEADRSPVAPDFSLTVDTQGQNPGAEVTQDLTTLAGYDGGNAPTTCSIAADPSNGTAVCLASLTVRYTPDADFTDGGATDTFTYRVTDDQGDFDEGDVTATITDVDPTIDYADVNTDPATPVTAPATTQTPGNGAPADHTLAVTAAADPAIAACTVDAAFNLTVTPAAAGNTQCDVTLTDTDGNNPSTDTVLIVIAAAPGGGIQVKLPGGSSALSPLSLFLLLGLPLLRRRRQG